MSHISKIDCKITNLNVLKKAVTNLKGEFKENQKEFTWYGSKKGECVHAISFPDAKYEIGVCKSEENPKAYTLKQDDYYLGGLNSYVGKKGWKLSQEYSIEQAKYSAKLHGFSSKTEVLEDRKRIRIFI